MCTHIRMYHTASLLCPPPFCDLLPGKRGGGGVTVRTCAFASQLSSPLLQSCTIITSHLYCTTLLCGGRGELYMPWQTEGWRSCWPHTTNAGKNIMLQHGRMTCRSLAIETVRDQWKRHRCSRVYIFTGKQDTSTN